uniref:Uncharacterized protein n=1 Tax=Echeneis naucrates TaxID=173247 RepID=A0A665X7F2_ECHNA
MSSMLSPASRRFSMSTSSSTSEKPRRSALEMSKTPPTAAASICLGERGGQVRSGDQDPLNR